MGTLFVHRGQSYSSLKCLVAASICGKNLKLVEFDDSEQDFIMKFQPLEDDNVEAAKQDVDDAGGMAHRQVDVRARVEKIRLIPLLLIIITIM